MQKRFDIFRGKKLNVMTRENMMLEAIESFGSATVDEIVEELHEKKFMVDNKIVGYWVMYAVKKGRMKLAEKRDCTSTGRLAQTYITDKKTLEAYYARRWRKTKHNLKPRTIETSEQFSFNF